VSTLIIDQGDDETLNVVVQTAAATLADLDGWTLLFYVKRGRDDADADAVLTKTTAVDGGITITAPSTNGAATITIEPEDTEDLTSEELGKSLFWTLQGIGPDDKITTLAKGRMVIRSDQLVATS
jgi:hypothetical protein